MPYTFIEDVSPWLKRARDFSRYDHKHKQNVEFYPYLVIQIRDLERHQLCAPWPSLRSWKVRSRQFRFQREWGFHQLNHARWNHVSFPSRRRHRWALGINVLELLLTTWSAWTSLCGMVSCWIPLLTDFKAPTNFIGFRQNSVIVNIGNKRKLDRGTKNLCLL